MIGSTPVFELFTGSLHYLKWLLPLLSFFFLAFAFLNHILLDLLCSDSFRTDTILYLAINTWAINYIFKFLSLNIRYLHSEIFIYGVGILVLYGYLSFRYYSALKFLVPRNHSLFLIFLVLSGLVPYLWTGYQSARAFTDIYQLDPYRLSATASTGINHVPLFFLLTTVFLFLLLLIGSLIWAARRSRTYMEHVLICAMIIFLCIQIAIPLFYGCGSSSQNTAFTGGISVYFLGLSDRIYPVTGTALAVLLNRFLNNRRLKDKPPVNNPDSVPPINAHE